MPPAARPVTRIWTARLTRGRTLPQGDSRGGQYGGALLPLPRPGALSSHAFTIRHTLATNRYEVATVRRKVESDLLDQSHLWTCPAARTARSARCPPRMRAPSRR